MPIYEYRCQSCEHELEKIQKFSDDPLVDCPACGRPQLKKLISAAGFRLKGSGWYETDFKKDRKRNLAGDSGAGKGESRADSGSSGDSPSGSGSKSESKSESKPAAKSASDKAA